MTEIFVAPDFLWSCQIWDQKFFGIFSFTNSGLWIFRGRGVQAITFFFLPYLRSINSQNFFLYQAFFLNLRAVSKRHQLFFGHAKFDVNNFSEFFPFEHSRLNVQIPTFFWSCQIWDQKFFGIFSFTKCSWLWNFLGRGVCLGTNFFWSCQIWSQKNFRIFSFIEYSRVSVFWGGWRSGHQLF